MINLLLLLIFLYILFKLLSWTIKGALLLLLGIFFIGYLFFALGFSLVLLVIVLIVISFLVSIFDFWQLS